MGKIVSERSVDLAAEEVHLADGTRVNEGLMQQWVNDVEERVRAGRPALESGGRGASKAAVNPVGSVAGRAAGGAG